MSDAARVQRLVFGEVADDYDRYRPHYPDELFERLLAEADPAAPVDAVLDIGCGTGRSAVAFAEHGLPGHAVEPDPAMAGVARTRLPETWTVETSDFEACGAGGRADWSIITCAQAWHWIDHERGLARAHELLRPGGVLALFWNRPTFHADELRDEMDRCYDRHAPDMQSSLRGRGAEPKGQVQGIDVEHPPEGWSAVAFDELWWEMSYSTERWLGLLNTHSDHRLLDPDVRDALHAEIGAAIDAHGGSFTLPYRVELIRFRR